jgi:hypothetical protein
MQEPYRRRVVAKVPAGIGLVCEQVKITVYETRDGVLAFRLELGKSVAYSTPESERVDVGMFERLPST